MGMFSSQTLLLKRSKFIYTFEYLDIQLNLKVISITISIYVNDFLNNTVVLTSKINAQIKKELKPQECILKCTGKNFLRK